MISKNELLKELNDLIDYNNKYIEDDMDGDSECKHEVETLESIIFLIEKMKVEKNIFVLDIKDYELVVGRTLSEDEKLKVNDKFNIDDWSDYIEMFDYLHFKEDQNDV